MRHTMIFEHNIRQLRLSGLGRLMALLIYNNSV